MRDVLSSITINSFSCHFTMRVEREQESEVKTIANKISQPGTEIFSLMEKLSDHQKEMLLAFGEGLSFAVANADQPPAQHATDTRDSA